MEGINAQGKLYGQVYGIVMHFLDIPLSHHLQVFINPWTHQILLFLNFCTSFTLQHASPSQKSMGRTKSSNYLIFLMTSPILRFCWDLTLYHLININSGVIERGFLWITKDTPSLLSLKISEGFSSHVPGTGMKTKYIFLINHNVTPSFSYQLGGIVFVVVLSC